MMQFMPAAVVSLLFGCVAMWWGIHSVSKGFESSNWPQVVGTILESRLTASRGSKGTSYAPDIVYGYTVNGQSYQRSRIDTRPGWDYDSSQAVVNAYPAGSQRTVYYCPTDPSDSILMKGLHPGSFFGIVLGTMIFTFGGMFGAIAYLAAEDPDYEGTGTYSCDYNSPVALVGAIGIIAIMLQFGVMFLLLIRPY